VACWLRDTGSLTHRLRARGRFAVEPLHQAVERPRADEAALLGLGPRRWALVRAVLLRLDDAPVVYARSVLPLTSLRGANRRLAHMRHHSLGAELFRAPAARRRAVWIARVPAEALPAAIGAGEPVWGRQSLFDKREQPLLVAEFFLPALWHPQPATP
jgi:chorismate--pyruvate lyase